MMTLGNMRANGQPSRLAITLIAFIWLSAARADNTTVQLRQAFDRCYWDSATAQLQATPQADLNSTAENAFMACASEEKAIRLFLRVNNADPARIELAILTIKLELKRSLRAVADDPNSWLYKLRNR
jgi:hypothetical protein